LVLKFCIWACSDSDKSKQRDQAAKLIDSRPPSPAGSFCRMAGTEPPRNLTIAERGDMASKTGITFGIETSTLAIGRFSFVAG